MGNIINQSGVSAGFIISGTATAGNVPVNGQTATVAIVDSSNVVKYTYTTTVTNGAWSVNVTAAQALALADGNYSIQATVSDTTGNTATTVTQTITVDTVPPTVTISTTDTTTNQPTQTISGHVTTTEAAAGATVTLFDTVNGITTQIGTAAVGSGGAWSTSVTLSGNGTHSIVAQDTDAAGNTGASTPVVFALDTAAPSIAITAPVAGDNIINKAEAAAGFTISGTATAGSGGAAVNGQTATITIVDGTNTVKDTYTTTVTGGAWSVNVTAAQAQGLADGSYSIKANVSDAAGNAAATASQAITVDETAPTIAITSPVAGDNIINKTEAAAGVTISGTATAGSAGSERPDRDDHDRRRHQRRQGHLYGDGDGWGVVGQRDGGAGARPGRRQLQHQGERIRYRRQCGDHGKPGDRGGYASADGSDQHHGHDDQSGNADDLRHRDDDRGRGRGDGDVVRYRQRRHHADRDRDRRRRGLVDQRDAGGQRHPQHRGPGHRCGRQHRVQRARCLYAGDRGTDDRDHGPGCRRQHHQQGRGGGGRHHQWHGRGRRRRAAVNGQTATITIVDGTNAIKDTYTATVTGGAWSVNVTAAQAQGLADGSYSIKANVSDAAGNAAATASQAITVDETAPTIAITSPVAGDNIINKSEAAAGVTISGTATAGTGGAAVNGQTATITIVDGTNAVKDTYTTTVTGGAGRST